MIGGKLRRHLHRRFHRRRHHHALATKRKDSGGLHLVRPLRSPGFQFMVAWSGAVSAAAAGMIISVVISVPSRVLARGYNLLRVFCLEFTYK